MIWVYMGFLLDTPIFKLSVDVIFFLSYLFILSTFSEIIAFEKKEELVEK